MVATSGASPIKLSTPQMREVITDATRSSARILQNPSRVIWTGRDGTTPGNCYIALSSPKANSPFLIGGISVSPTRWHSGSLEVLNKRQSAPPSVSRDYQKFDASADGKLSNDGDSTSIFSKLIGREMSHIPSADIYSRCQMHFTSNAVVTEAPNFMDLVIPDVNTSNEFNTFGTPTIRIRRTTDGPHWSAPDHIFGEATTFGMSGIRS